MTKLQRITLAAYNARRQAEKRASETGFSSDLHCFCARGSAILFRHLKKMGFRPKIVMSTDGHWAHVWVRCSGYLVDITASQFDQDDVMIVPMKRVPQEWYWISSATEQVKEFNSVEDLQVDQIHKHWPVEQVAE